MKGSFGEGGSFVRPKGTGRAWTFLCREPTRGTDRPGRRKAGRVEATHLRRHGTAERRCSPVGARRLCGGAGRRARTRTRLGSGWAPPATGSRAGREGRRLRRRKSLDTETAGPSLVYRLKSGGPVRRRETPGFPRYLRHSTPTSTLA